MEYKDISLKSKYRSAPHNTCSKNIIDSLPNMTKIFTFRHNVSTGEKTVNKTRFHGRDNLEITYLNVVGILNIVLNKTRKTRINNV